MVSVSKKTHTSNFLHGWYSEANLAGKVLVRNNEQNYTNYLSWREHAISTKATCMDCKICYLFTTKKSHIGAVDNRFLQESALVLDQIETTLLWHEAYQTQEKMLFSTTDLQKHVFNFSGILMCINSSWPCGKPSIKCKNLFFSQCSLHPSL